MTLLNDVEKIRELDPGNMYNSIFDLPEHMENALKICKKWKINPDDFSDIKNVVVVGMGGSAIGGDLVRSYLNAKIMVPFHVCRHYNLPEFVDDETLVIVSSYSGNTEETLSAVDDALTRKAMIAAVSTGGMLNEVAELNQIPIAILPEGMQPRAALGYSFTPLLYLLEKVGLVKDVVSELKTTTAKLKLFRENYIEDISVDKNMPKKLAERIQGKIPIIYSGPTITDVVGFRWKCQICENSKILAFNNQFAEFNHNELVGWSEKIEEKGEHLVVLMLRDFDDMDQIKARMDIVKEIIEALNVEVIEIYSRGDSVLERMFSLIQIGDFASYYLAILTNTDPSPVNIIDYLKDSISDLKKK